MSLLRACLSAIAAVLDLVLEVGRWFGILAIGMMVVAILIQVFYRYILNSALPWPDEAARFCMLWMTGLLAPIAFRRGSFVAIETFPLMLPKRLFALLSLVLLFLSLGVLLVAVTIGYSEVTGFGGRFATASLYVPTAITFDEWYRIPRSWMMMSLLTGVGLLIVVNIELILKSFVDLIDGRDPDPQEIA